MGRLPAVVEGRVVQQRIPYELSGEMVVTSGMQITQYPDSTFQNSQNKTFEVHRMIPRVIPQIGGVPSYDATDLLGVPPQDFLLSLLRINIFDLNLNQAITKSPTIINSLLKGSSELTWEWAEPHNMPNNAQFQVSLQALTFPAGFADLIDQLRVAVTFEGFNLVLGPPV